MRSNEFAYLFDSRFPAVILEYPKCIKLHIYTSKYTYEYSRSTLNYTFDRTLDLSEETVEIVLYQRFWTEMRLWWIRLSGR